MVLVVSLLCVTTVTGATAAVAPGGDVVAGETTPGAPAPGGQGELAGLGADPGAAAQATTTATQTPRPDIRFVNVTLVDDDIALGEEATVVVTLENRGDAPGERTLTLDAGRRAVAEETVRVEPGASVTVELTFTPEEEGKYLMLVNGVYAGNLSVTDETPERLFGVPLSLLATAAGWIGFVAGGALLAGSVALLARRLATARNRTRESSPRPRLRWQQLWIAGGALLLAGVAVDGLPETGALVGLLALLGYGVYGLVLVVYRSGR